MTASSTADASAAALTAEERLLRDTAREFAQREVAPTAIERDEEERFDRSIFARMGELGLTAAPLPETVGGGGFSYLGWTLVMEELGAADMASAVMLSVHLLGQFPVVTYGTEEQQERWLPAMVAGEALGAFCLTEPSGGSDAAALRTSGPKVRRRRPRARTRRPARPGRRIPPERNQDLDLECPEAERYLVFATLDPALGPKGITAFPVEKGTPGFRFGAHEKKMGIRPARPPN
ncbi:MAG: acyl-CoA dehydrogenase family protein [Anaerolineales bacterium]|nr:acyl-CoA dehydrogenase family protein [Anaerolineales bacterium]